MSKNYQRDETAFAEDVDSKISVLKTIDDLCPCWVPTSPWAPASEKNITNFEGNRHNSFLNEPLSSAEFLAALGDTKSRSIPGSDGIDYRILKALLQEIKNCLVRVLNDLFFGDLFPKTWNEFLVFIIPKADKKKFRPISMSQCMLKLMEKIIFNRIYGWLESRNILPKTQFGFRRNKPCAYNLGVFHSSLCYSKMQKKTTVAVFLDVEGAYDNVFCDILIEKLGLGLGFPSNYSKFVHNLVYFGTVRLLYNDVDLIRHVFKGLPQGSVLSPLLYIIYVADLELAFWRIWSIFG